MGLRTQAIAFWGAEMDPCSAAPSLVYFFSQEAGYKQALKCNGEYIDEHKLKVEPCMSAGPKSNGRQKKADRSSQKSQFSSPAPKVQFLDLRTRQDKTSQRSANVRQGQVS